MQRTLTLTEELERLEQQITLTLQEIDSNFSKAHRIVTSSILPVVEEYAKHSNDVWESSKYWKQFFEAAANVSLSGYEEAALEDELPSTSEHTVTDLTTAEEQTAGAVRQDSDNDFDVNSPTQNQSTPKQKNPVQPTRKTQRNMLSPSPRRYTGKNPLGQDDEPSTPNADRSQFSSPFQQQHSALKLSGVKTGSVADPMLHRSVLDKNYRVQSTPFKNHPQPDSRRAATPNASVQRALWDDSPDSSPEMPPPQLRDDFFSPPKQATSTRHGLRTPGVSVQATVKTDNAPITSTGRTLFGSSKYDAGTAQTLPAFDSDDEDAEDSLGMSPPKTLQFHIPQSRLMQTPAREASKKIVEDLLATAGVADDTTSDLDLILDASPTVIRASHDPDTTF